jgi:L-lactate dehydrogenase complex protein LldF
MSGPAEQIDAATGRFLARIGRSLPVLADPSAAAAAPRSADLPDLLHLRTLARDVRQHTVDHLDTYLDEARVAIELGGGHVHLAADAAAARSVVAALVGASAVTVLPSSLVDEVGMRPAAAAGATVAVVAAAFVVAETGHVCLTSDDPALMAASQETTLVCLAGIEAVLPRPADLAVMLKLLARAATGRSMRGYTVLVDPRTRGRALHLVLVDNGRSDLLGGDFRSLLRCIGCGACTNVCPVYRAADVRPSGLWTGPIGALVQPLLRPDGGADDLPHTSTLCGACADVCPVRIDLPAHLIALRSRSPRRTLGLRFWAWAMLSPARYRWATRWARRRGGSWPAPPRRSFHELWWRRGR